MNLNEVIFKRRSVRSYRKEPIDTATLEEIVRFTDTLTPLYPNIKVRSDIVTKDQVRTIFPWAPPHFIAVYSEEKEGARENVGFLYQQLELYLQSRGLGVCWIGLGKMSRNSVVNTPDDNLSFVILLGFGYPKEEQYRTPQDFKRRPLTEIADTPDDRLEPARLAPSSCNSQPWYFTHEGDVIHTYCKTKVFMGKLSLADFNRIDMGIVLSHLYVSYPDAFRFFRREDPTEIDGYEYTGSFTL